MRYRRSISRAAALGSRSAVPTTGSLGGGSRWATFAFRTALADGLVFAAATPGATLQDLAFDVSAAIQHLFAEGLVVAYRLSSEQQVRG